MDLHLQVRVGVDHVQVSGRARLGSEGLQGRSAARDQAAEAAVGGVHGRVTAFAAAGARAAAIFVTARANVERGRDRDSGWPLLIAASTARSSGSSNLGVLS